MPIIDADTHIDETEDTWEYLRDFEQQYKPTTQFPSRVDPSKPPVRYWLVVTGLVMLSEARLLQRVPYLALFTPVCLVENG